MRNGHSILNLIWDWSRIVERARQVKQDPEKRQKVVRFGVCAVIYAILTALCACALLLFQVGFDSGIVLGVLILILAIGIGGFGTLISFITALIYWFCQLSVNRKAGTWITLILVLVCFAAAVAIPFMFMA